MGNITAAVKAIWPKGIPVQDYEKAFAAMGALTRLVSYVEAQEPPRPLRPVSSRIGRRATGLIVEALKTGPKTVKEVMQETGLSLVTVHYGVKSVANVVEKRVSGSLNGGGRPLNVYALKEEPK